MLLTDPSGSLPTQPRRAGCGRISRSDRFAALAIFFVGFAAFGATVSFAQDQPNQSVAEAARQERARKQELQKHSAHVYSDDDLKHAQILTPADRAVVEARRNECAQKNNCSSAPSQNPPGSMDANSQPNGTSLGEVARKYRKQKELQALKPKQSEPFHLSIGTPALASPILPERPEIRLPVQPELRPKISSHVLRRDPFSAAPIRPEVRRPEVRRSEVRVPENSPSVYGAVRSESRPDARASVRKNIRPTVHAETAHHKMSGEVRHDARPKIREDVLPIFRPHIHPEVHREVRPDVRSKAHDEFVPVGRPNAHQNLNSAVRPKLSAGRRLTAPAQPKIFSRRAPPSLLLQPMQPPIPSNSAPPVAPVSPVSSIRPAEAQPDFVSGAAARQRTLTVQPGDTLWRLAQQTLGHGSRWPELLAANRWIANANLIRPGAQLRLPLASSISETVAHASDARLGRGDSVLLVRRGDSLWSLAKSNLGRSSDWPCLAAANPSLRNPNVIYGGQRLLLPTACGPDAARPALTVHQKPHSILHHVP